MASLKARDVMRRRVFTLRPEDTLREAARLFLAKNVTGAPVVDAAGRVVGVVSQRDFVRRADEVDRGRAPAFYREGERLRLAPPVNAAAQARVRDAMTVVVLSVAPETPARAVARLMTAKRVHRVLVVDSGRLAGIISSLDLLEALV
jgi:CBS-domain-containing membrane protein